MLRFKNLLVLIPFLVFAIRLSSQNLSEYLGVIKLNDSSTISYQLNLADLNENISGYSITDIGGSHETKSNIIGTIDKKNNLSFKEIDIVYTKSDITNFDFCFIHFAGKVERSNIKGVFKGLYKDGTTCIDGEIIVRSVKKIEKKAKKLNRIISKVQKVDSIKNNVNIIKILDSLKMNVLKANQTLSMFSSSKSIKLIIYDGGKVDGDRINLYVDEKIILKNFLISKTKKVIEIPINSNKTTVKLRALNVGSISPNTAKVEIINNTSKINVLTSLKKGEKTTINILKKH